MTQAVHVDSLLADARLVLEYALRAGRLPDDALPRAIQRLQARREDPNCTVGLVRAMNQVMRRIAPMTLVDLRAGRNPFDPRNVRARIRWQVGLSIATVLLIVFIAYNENLVQHQASALRAWKEVVEARGSERVTEVRKQVQQGALERDCCGPDSYQKARHELRQLADRTAGTLRILHELSSASMVPLRESSGWVAGWLGALLTAAHAMPGAPAAPSVEGDHAAPAPDEAGDPCAEPQRSGRLGPGYSAWLRNVALDQVDDFCFASWLEVDILAVSDPVRGSRGTYFGRQGLDFELVPKLEQRMRVQVGWLLPFLYGLLGACVYVMRRLLFDNENPVVEHMVILLRLALGAIAGVAIGWFAAPGVGGPALAAGAPLPYAIAFLAGFSIEVLFTLLDALKRLVIERTRSA